MKKISYYLYIILFVWLIIGCGQTKNIRYELVNGNPDIDYIEFLNDTMCCFVAPGPLAITCRYIKQDSTYTIFINNIVNARLYEFEKDKLYGEPPFFEGTWINVDD